MTTDDHDTATLILRFATHGLTPAQILDLLMVEHEGMDANLWARIRGITEHSVLQNGERGQLKLDGVEGVDDR